MKYKETSLWTIYLLSMLSFTVSVLYKKNELGAIVIIWLKYVPTLSTNIMQQLHKHNLILLISLYNSGIAESHCSLSLEFSLAKNNCYVSFWFCIWPVTLWIFFFLILSPHSKSKIIGLNSVTANTASQIVIDNLNSDRVTAWI